MVSTPPPHPPAAAPGAAWLRWVARWPLPSLRALGALLGALLYLGARRRRRIVQTNLAACFPEESAATRERWARETFRTFGITFIDRIWLWHAPEPVLRQRVQVHGLEHLPAGGVLCFAPHFLGLDAGWSRLTLEAQHPWWTLYSRQSSPMLDAWVRAGRKRHPQAQLVVRQEGLRPLLRALRQGAAVYLLPDMDLGTRDSVFVPFFGVPTATVTSLGRLARAAQVPVVAVVCRLLPEGYRIDISPVWNNFPTGDETADTRTMNARLEDWVRTMPGQYHWLHRRFKTRPDGDAPFYPK